ncbi:hypothetical protein Tsubulata_001509, partial [Turnera subulata]
NSTNSVVHSSKQVLCAICQKLSILTTNINKYHKDINNNNHKMQWNLCSSKTNHPGYHRWNDVYATSPDTPPKLVSC